jgi:hypothetical protein
MFLHPQHSSNTAHGLKMQTRAQRRKLASDRAAVVLKNFPPEIHLKVAVDHRYQ